LNFHLECMKFTLLTFKLSWLTGWRMKATRSLVCDASGAPCEAEGLNTTTRGERANLDASDYAVGILIYINIGRIGVEAKVAFNLIRLLLLLPEGYTRPLLHSIKVVGSIGPHLGFI
jgi:hypothetical protein